MEAEIHQRLEEIHAEIDDQLEFLAFAASTDKDYEIAHARLAGLRKEKKELNELL